MHEVYATEYDSIIPLTEISDVILQKIEIDRSLVSVGPTEVPEEPVVPEEIEGEVITGDVVSKSQTLQCQKIRVLSYKNYNRYRTMLRRLNNETQDWMTDRTAIALGLIPVFGQEMHFLFCRYYCSYLNLPYQNGKESFPSNCKERYKKLNTFTVRPRARMYSSRNHYSIIRRVNGIKTAARHDELIFLQRLYKFMLKRKTPIQRLPCLGFKQIDLFQFYKCVQLQGGYDQITSKRLWKNIYDTMGGDPGSTSAATCTRKHYERLLLPFERHLNDDFIPDEHGSILQEANIENIPSSEPAVTMSENKFEDTEIVNDKIVIENKIDTNVSNGELSILKNMLGFSDKVEPENHDAKRNEGLKLKLEKLPKREHNGKSKDYWQKKAIVSNESPSVNSKPDKDDRWTDVRKKNVLARTWARIQKAPKTTTTEKHEPSPKHAEPLSQQSEMQKTILLNLMELKNDAHGDPEQRLNAISSSISPSDYSEILAEAARIPIVPETITKQKVDPKKTQGHSPLPNNTANVESELVSMSSYGPFRKPIENAPSVQDNEVSGENTLLRNASCTPPLDNISMEKVYMPTVSNSRDPTIFKAEDLALPPHLYSTNNSKTVNKGRTHRPDSSENGFTQNQNLPLYTSVDETSTHNVKLSDALLYQRPSVIIHTEQICSPPPILPSIASKVVDKGVMDNGISHQTLISQNREQFVNSLKTQQPQIENKIITKQFYDPITKQLHDLPIVEPVVPKIKATSNTPCAKRKINSKKSSDSHYGRNDPCDKMKNTLWKGSNTRKNTPSHPSSNKTTKRKKSVASNQNSLTKSAAVLSVPVVEEKKLKLPIPVIHSSPFISSLSKYASISFKRAPRIYRDPESSGSNEPIDLSLRCIGKGRNRKIPSNGISDTMGLDLSLRKGSSPHASSTCGIENITPPPVTALRDASLYSNGLDYIPSAVRKKFQQAFLETKALSVPHNKGSQPSTPVSQMAATSVNFISRNHPLYSVPISSNSSRYPEQTNDNDPRFKPNAYMSPLWFPPSYDAKSNMPQLAPHVDTKPFSLNHLPHEFYPYINNERQCCNDELFSHRSK